MTAYYNEINPFAAAWLRELIKDGLIAPGDVDERSIVDVRATDLVGYIQCHFFAGIGGWSYALRLAGWPDDRPVWTGSCPCQPFSTAGKQAGTKDDRHLWPEFYRLIRECHPDTVFGEQVAAAIGFDWLDHVSADLEAEDYAVGSIVLGAHSVGAPHIRQRLWFVADRASERRGEARTGGGRSAQRTGDGGESGELVQPRIAGLEGQSGHGDDGYKSGRDDTQPCGSVTEESATRGFWHPADWLPCRDGKSRPVEPGTFPLAHGLPARMGRLRGYGNAIVPQVAAEVIRAHMHA